MSDQQFYAFMVWHRGLADDGGQELHQAAALCPSDYLSLQRLCAAQALHEERRTWFMVPYDTAVGPRTGVAQHGC